MKLQITLDSTEDREILALVLPLLQGEKKAQPSYVMEPSVTEPILAEPRQETTSVQSTLNTEPTKEEVTKVKEEPTPEVKEETTEPKLTNAQWNEKLVAKKQELGITPGSDKAKAFGEFVKTQCAPYGAELPRSLNDTTRYKFVNEVFDLIEYDPAIGFYINNLPKQVPS